MKIRHLLVALFAMVSFGAVACGGNEPVPDEQPVETPAEETTQEEAPAETAPVEEAPAEEPAAEEAPAEEAPEAAEGAEGTAE